MVRRRKFAQSYPITLRERSQPAPGERYTAAITIRLTPRMHALFRTVCARAGRSASDVIRGYIHDAIMRDGLGKERSALPASPKRRKRRRDAGKPRPRRRESGD